MMQVIVDKKMNIEKREVKYDSCLICNSVLPMSEMYNSRVCSHNCWDLYRERGE